MSLSVFPIVMQHNEKDVIGISVHFLDQEFQFRNIILCLQYLDNSLDNEKFLEIMKSYGLYITNIYHIICHGFKCSDRKFESFVDDMKLYYSFLSPFTGRVIPYLTDYIHNTLNQMLLSERYEDLFKKLKEITNIDEHLMMLIDIKKTVMESCENGNSDSLRFSDAFDCFLNLDDKNFNHIVILTALFNSGQASYLEKILDKTKLIALVSTEIGRIMKRKVEDLNLIKSIKFMVNDFMMDRYPNYKAADFWKNPTLGLEPLQPMALQILTIPTSSTFIEKIDLEIEHMVHYIESDSDDDNVNESETRDANNTTDIGKKLNSLDVLSDRIVISQNKFLFD